MGTYHCPDGWTLQEDSRGGCRCFLISGNEAVTRADADILCAFHDGAWVSEIDYPGINYWLKGKLLDELEVGEWGQFWLGATTEDRHRRVLPASGHGITATRPRLGLTGGLHSPTTSTGRTAWPCW